MREPDRIIRLKTVLARSGLSRSTIYRKIIEGTFPPQIRISIHGAGWRESDINRWVADPVSWRPKGQRDKGSVKAAADSAKAGMSAGRSNTVSPTSSPSASSAAATNTDQHGAGQLGSRLGQALRAQY